VVSFDYSNIGREYSVIKNESYLRFFSLRQMCDDFIAKIVLSRALRVAMNSLHLLLLMVIVVIILLSVKKVTILGFF